MKVWRKKTGGKQEYLVPKLQIPARPAAANYGSRQVSLSRRNPSGPAAGVPREKAWGVSRRRGDLGQALRRCAVVSHGPDVTQGEFRLRPLPLPPLLQPLPPPLPPPPPSSGLVLPKMAPLDLDKYVEIARLCKYLPENDLKVSSVGAGALLVGFAPSGSGAPAGPPFSTRDPRRPLVPSRWRA